MSITILAGAMAIKGGAGSRGCGVMRECRLGKRLNRVCSQRKGVCESSERRVKSLYRFIVSCKELAVVMRMIKARRVCGPGCQHQPRRGPAIGSI